MGFELRLMGSKAFASTTGHGRGRTPTGGRAEREVAWGDQGGGGIGGGARLLGLAGRSEAHPRHP